MLGVIDDEAGEVALEVRPQVGAQGKASVDPGEDVGQGAIRSGPFPEVVVGPLGAIAQHNPGESIPTHLPPRLPTVSRPDRKILGWASVIVYIPGRRSLN